MIDQTKPIFSIECHEPAGIITRSVYPMILTHDNLIRFWELTKQFKVLFDGTVSDFKSFCEMFITVDEERSTVEAHGLFWRIDDFVGIYYMTHIAPTDAQIHYSFFDRRHRGRHKMTREMIKYVFEKYQFRRLTAEIPYCAGKTEQLPGGKIVSRGTFQFVEEVGLKYEGRKRKSFLFDDEWFDTRCYGILREEAQWP